MVLLWLPANAQRTNRNGLKMVSRLTIETSHVTNTQVSRREVYCWDVEYLYDDNGSLIGINKGFEDNGNAYEERYRVGDPIVMRNGRKRMNDTVKVAIYKNGKFVPNSKIRLLRGGYRLEDYAVYENNSDEVAFWQKNLYRYRTNKLGVYQIEFKEFSSFELSNERRKSWYNSMIDKASEGDLSRYTDHLGDFGKMTDFVGMYDEYVTKDGKCYFSRINDDAWCVRNMTFINGNMQPGARNDIKYSDRINDTNIEFYGFAHLTEGPSYYANIEWSTEWLKTRSKNLILSEKNECEWEYTFDAKGNLREIRIDSYNHHNRIVINVQYVPEESSLYH